jgi:chromosome segregation protein
VEITRYETEAASLLSELSHSESQLVDARKLVHETNQKLGTLSLDECQVQVAHWDTRVAVIEQKQIDIQKRHQEQQEAIKRYQHLQSSLQERLDETSISMEELDQEQSSQRIAETELGEEIKEYQNLIEPSEIELDEIDKEHTELLKAETISRQSLSMAEHFYAQARIALDRKQEALQSLRRHIEEDFGLVAFEYTEQVSGPTPLPLEGMVEQLPKVSQLSQEIEEAIRRQRAQLRRMGAINPEAQAEYHEVKQRFGFLTEQVADLHQAERDVHQVIEELDILMEREFRKTFQAVAVEFRQIFTRLFGGGSARLILTDPEEMTTTGIDIEARLPGRRTQGLSLLSGGERSLTATALIFALLKVSPTPFCVLDEVDAMLDEVNVGRYRELLSELSHNTQFVIVTHNRNTVQAADVIYGVTMGRDSVSQVLSLKLDEVGQVVD